MGMVDVWEKEEDMYQRKGVSIDDERGCQILFPRADGWRMSIQQSDTRSEESSTAKIAC
jgi:hypothetical protein